MIEHINSENFNEKIKSGISVVKCTAEFCGPCKSYSPIFNKFAETTSLQGIKFYTIDAGEELEISKKYLISRVPLTIIFKDGKEIIRKDGVLNEASLTGIICGAM